MTMITFRCTRRNESEIGQGVVQYEIGLTEVRPAQAVNPQYDAQYGQPAPAAQTAPIQITFVTTDAAVGDAYRRGSHYVLMPAEQAPRAGEETGGGQQS